MTHINDARQTEDDLDNAAWDKVLSDPSSRQVLQRIVSSSMQGPFSVDSATSDSEEVVDINRKDDDELR